MEEKREIRSVEDEIKVGGREIKGERCNQEGADNKGSEKERKYKGVNFARENRGRRYFCSIKLYEF